MGEEVIVGIDLGTTNSLVAVCDQAGPRVIPDAQGRPLLPSVVRYEAGRVEVGHEARAQAPDYPTTTVSSVKRLMGRSVEDAAGDVKFLSYAVAAGERGTSRVVIPSAGGGPPRLVSPEEVSAAILVALRQRAEAALGREVRKAVVTVPAYFDDAQRQATRVAGRLAGLEVVRLVPEPTAAALAYGLGLPRTAGREPANVVVYDLGGGTFDVSVLRLTPSEGDDPNFYQVLAVGGDTRLGGDDIDHLLMELMRTEMAARLGADPASTMALPPQTRRQLGALAESVKIRLSEAESAAVRIDMGGGRVYERTITRGEFEKLIGPLVERTIRACEGAMAGAARALRGEAISAAVLVGGSTRIPLVRRRVGEFFGLPAYAALDPDQVVALGAAVQGAILSGASRGSLLLDVIPLSLGVETVGGAVAKVIVRNSTVPARATEMFSTSVDGQTSIRLTVFQGEREMAADCRRLGEFHLRGIPPMPAGIPQVEVTFLVDANGVLNVSATERRSGKRATLQVVPNHGLTPAEVERIEAESLAHAREDMTRHRITDLVANCTLDLKWIGERLAKHGEALELGYRAELERLTTELREMVSRAAADWRSADADAMHRAKEALDRASVRLMEVSITASLRETPPKK